MICEKYGMTAADYSVSGAVFGVDSGRSHIANQIKAAARAKVQPDVILINGGTNDMEYVTRGDVVTGYDPKNVNERTFAGGFEYAAYLLGHYWKNVPVIYIRAHDMDTVDDAVEQEYGDMALTIAEKWHLTCVDIYNDTDFCTEDDAIRDAYTAYKSKLGHSDGIHPTALGYAKFYLPPIAGKLGDLFQ
jgi:lysophospholipase L1-like esterase